MMNERPAGGRNQKWLLGVLALVVGIGIVVAVLSRNVGAVLLSFLPYLLILACPLMMLFMMGPMGHNHMAGHDGHQGSVSGTTTPNLHGLSRDDQVRALRGELTRLAWRQEALRQDLERLESEPNAEQVVDAEHTTHVEHTDQTEHAEHREHSVGHR